MKDSQGRMSAAKDSRLKNKPIGSRNRNSKKKETKPLPEAVLEKLEKKKARLAKKLEKPKEEIRRPKEFKKKQKSYQYGLDTLNTQIEEVTEELEKSLKKRTVPDSLNAILEKEKTLVTRNDIGQMLREKAISAQKAMDKAKKIKEDQVEAD